MQTRAYIGVVPVTAIVGQALLPSWHTSQDCTVCGSLVLVLSARKIRSVA